MCVAIHAKATGTLIPFEEFEMMRLSNADGMGMMWAEEGKLKIVRQLRRLRRFWGRYKALHEAGHGVVIHFRLATHGSTDMRNVHPVHVNSRLALVHNGILDGFAEKDVRSDTRQFVDAILKQLPNDWYKDDNAVWNTIDTLTAGSKMIFMDADGLVRIMHEGAGWQRGGNWFSTMSWKLPVHAGGYHLLRGLRDWWDGVDDGPYPSSYRPQYPPSRGEPDPYANAKKWEGETASGAYLHDTSGEIVCVECRKTLMPNEPHYHFQTLWNDKEPIVCDLCDKCVNQDELIAMYGVGATVTGG